MLGKGVVIKPEEGIITAPFAGEISTVAETGHAVGITSKDGMEILIHVGIDTVNMNGKGFTPKVKTRDQVESGQKLLEFNREEIKQAGYSDIVVIMLLNGDHFPDIEFMPNQKVDAGMQIIKTVS